ncbi:hypothetical protein EPO05_01555 [Patescibacteria group bacterium]|nr:MAG: hypothetical protein EPO05_01555 [Patescibacteria group bacterium]
MRRRALRKIKSCRKVTAKVLKKIPLPKLESALFALLIVFSISFGLLLFASELQIRNEKTVTDVPPRFVIDPQLKEMVTGYPMEKMLPQLSKLDKETAAYLVAIAKKESNWGKHSPKKNGIECYNYWGFRGTYNQTLSGYSCFDSPAQAVRVVGRRIAELVSQGINTPEEMVVWKCGSTCAGHDPGAVRKWIQDVQYYHHQMFN